MYMYMYMHTAESCHKELSSGVVTFLCVVSMTDQSYTLYMYSVHVYMYVQALVTGMGFVSVVSEYN